MSPGSTSQYLMRVKKWRETRFENMAQNDESGDENKTIVGKKRKRNVNNFLNEGENQIT